MSRNRDIPHISDHDADYVRGLVMAETDDVLVFNKPSGLPSQVRGNRARNLDHLLWAFARSNGKRPRLVHRLDVGTSGVIIAGKTKPAAARLSAAFARRDAKKTYLALVGGDSPKKDSGVFDASIARVETDRGTQIVADHPEGKRAHTRWRLLSRGAECALLELKPTTGRMHQLRVHLSHAGCPILGDRIYGEQRSAPRLMLHAARLEVPDDWVFDARLPEDFVAVCETRGLSYDGL